MVIMKTKSLWNIHSLWEQFSPLVKVSKLSKKIKEQFFSEGSNNGFHLVPEFSFKHSTEPVFSDDYGSYLGLEQSQVIEHQGKQDVGTDVPYLLNSQPTY
jgi:hypothetical protein